MEEKNTSINIDVGVGVMGMTTYRTTEGENSKTTLIERQGSMIVNHIPSVIVICEDDLSKTIIQMIAGEIKGSYKIITAGAWNNLPTLLYGIYVYREQLKASGDSRFLEVICVTDGDIRNEHLDKVLSKLHSGINVPEDMKISLALAKESLYSFQLEHSKRLAGLPEYHHKIWLSEVSQEIITSYHQEEVIMLESHLVHADEENARAIRLTLMLLKKKIAEVNRISEASREIPLHIMQDDKDRIDCHKYYGILKDKLSKGDSLTNHQLHNIEYSVLSIIKKYNPNRWQSYISPVKDAMNKAHDNHVKMFSPDRFNLTELCGKK